MQLRMSVMAAGLTCLICVQGPAAESKASKGEGAVAATIDTAPRSAPQQLAEARIQSKETGMIGTDAGSLPRDVQKEEANRKLVLSLFNSGNIQDLIDHMDSSYRQHNPTVADGKEGAVAYFREMGRRYPKAKAYVVRTAADGDLVWVHAHLVLEPGTPGVAMVDIFRVVNGKFVEHWDVLQPVPQNPANKNTMF